MQQKENSRFRSGMSGAEEAMKNSQTSQASTRRSGQNTTETQTAQGPRRLIQDMREDPNLSPLGKLMLELLEEMDSRGPTQEAEQTED